MAVKKKKTEDVERIEGEIVNAGTIPDATAEMEFKLINPTEDKFLRIIKWNREELEEAIKRKVALYENVIYTDDNIQQAKLDRAELNKLTKAIDEKRKAVKNIVMEPYKTFEEEVKEVLRLIEKPVGMIESTIKEYENEKREEKYKKIEGVYELSIGELKDVLPFSKVFDMKYLNATFSLSKAQNEVKEKIERVKRDLETIDSLESKYKLNAKDVYIKSLDLSEALAENKRLLELEEKFEADKRRKAEEEAEAKRRNKEERRKEEERKLAEEQEREKAPNEEMQQEQASKEEEAVDSFSKEKEGNKQEQKKYRTKFCAVGTAEQLKGLIKYMQENNIEYGRIE